MKVKTNCTTVALMVLVVLASFVVFSPGISAYLTKEQREGLRIDQKAEKKVAD